MHKRVRKKLLQRYGRIFGQMVIVIVSLWWVWASTGYRFSEYDFVERVTIVDDGAVFVFDHLHAYTVDDVLRATGITLAHDDRVFPAREDRVFSEDVITIDRVHTVTITVDKEQYVVQTFRDRVGDVLVRADVHLDSDDLVEPSRAYVVMGHTDVAVTRVVIKEEAVTQKIPFDTKEVEDATMSFLKKTITQKGEYGIKKITYRVAYHDGVEVKRSVMGTEITKEPVTEKVAQGTKVTVRKTHRGACSWYSHTGTLSAANPWMAIGSYARVTNMENGKSVIVRINDRGPFVQGRIIDLDKVAFEKIASLGAGVITVKVEEIY